MTTDLIAEPIPHSIGINRPSRSLPPHACDSHMHIFDPRFSASKHWTRQPPVATVETYRKLQARLGTSRTVVVNPSTYGTDNACTLDAVAQLGAGARAVAVVDADVSDAHLDELYLQGVRGLRVNFVSPQSWGETTAEMLTKTADKAARSNMHVQIFSHSEQIVSMASVLESLPANIVIDHIALIDPQEGAGSLAYGVVRSLLDRGNTWVKLSGAYMRSKVGEPSYSDVINLGVSLVRAAPERMVWGSDWPHTTQPRESVNDASLLELLRTWCCSDTVMDQILVANPAQLYGFDDAV